MVFPLLPKNLHDCCDKLQTLNFVEFLSTSIRENFENNLAQQPPLQQNRPEDYEKYYICVDDSLEDDIPENDKVPSLTSEQFNQIQIFIYTKHHFKQRDCAICLNDFKEMQKVKSLLCGHLFCMKCLKDWTEVKETCPNCRKIIAPLNKSIFI